MSLAQKDRPIYEIARAIRAGVYDEVVSDWVEGLKNLTTEEAGKLFDAAYTGPRENRSAFVGASQSQGPEWTETPLKLGWRSVIQS
jgi:cell division inhibitor SulA